MVLNALNRLHPAVAFGFFTAVILLAVLGNHPSYQAIGLAAAVANYIALKGRSSVKTLAALVVAFCALALINPLFVPQGETVLFTYAGSRPYTLQAVAYGASTATLFVTVVLWFGCFNAVLSSEKLTFLFGKAAPAITLTLTMVLRLVPLYQRKARQIATARRCVGLSAWEGPLPQRIRSGSAELSALATWGLEGAIVTADSMRSRGFGTGARTNYARYRLTAPSVAFAVAGGLLFAVALTGAVNAGATMFVPTFHTAPLEGASLAGLWAYGLLGGLPLLTGGWEAARWHVTNQ